MSDCVCDTLPVVCVIVEAGHCSGCGALMTVVARSDRCFYDDCDVFV